MAHKVYLLWLGGTSNFLGTFENVPDEFFNFDQAGLDSTLRTRSFVGIFCTNRKSNAELGTSTLSFTWVTHYETSFFRISPFQKQVCLTLPLLLQLEARSFSSKKILSQRSNNLVILRFLTPDSCPLLSSFLLMEIYTDAMLRGKSIPYTLDSHLKMVLVTHRHRFSFPAPSSSIEIADTNGLCLGITITDDSSESAVTLYASYSGFFCFSMSEKLTLRCQSKFWWCELWGGGQT